MSPIRDRSVRKRVDRNHDGRLVNLTWNGSKSGDFTPAGIYVELDQDAVGCDISEVIS
jgi:hypothetical protein